MKTLTMTATAKSTKAEFQGANEDEQCRIASSGDYLVGMQTAKAGTVVKVSDTNMTEEETIKFYASYYAKNWGLSVEESTDMARGDVRVMKSLASHFDLGQKLLVKVYKSGRIAVTNL